MNKSGLWTFTFLVFIVALVSCNQIQQEQTFQEIKAIVKVKPEQLEEAKVVRVIDGDTFVAGQNGKEYKIRMILIDTPESGAPNRPDGFLGKEAKSYVNERLKGKTVWLEKDVQSADRYGRWLRYVYLDVTDSKGEFFNGTLVRSGLARMATFPPNVKYAGKIREWQTEARTEGRGVWKNIEEAFPDRRVEN